MSLRVILAIARKDISDAIKNMYILFALVLPVGIALILNFVMGGPEGTGSLSIAYFAPEGSRIIENLRQNSFVDLVEVRSVDALKEAAGDNVVGGLYVPEGFDQAVQAGQQPDLYVYQNHRAGGGELATFQRLVEMQVWELAGQVFPATVHWEGISPFRGVGDSNEPAASAGSEFNLNQYMLGLFLVMALAMAGVFMVPYLLVEEKEKHTLDALLLSPAGPLEVILGKAITGMFYSLIISVVLLTLNQGWSGNWMVTVTVVLLTALFVVGLGLFLGSLFSTITQVNTWSSIIMLVLMIPTWIGVFRLPQIVDYVFRVIPTYYLSEALSFSLIGQANLAQVGSSLGILAASVLLIYALVVWTLRQRATA